MGDRAHGAEQSGVADNDVEPAEALIEGGAELVDLVHIGQIQRRQGGLAAGCADCVVDLFQPALGAGDQDDMGALGGNALGHGRPDATGCAGNQRNAIL